MAEKQNILFEWNYEDNKNRSPAWYIIAFSLALALIIWGFLSRQYGLSIAVMLVSGIFFFLENNQEDTVQVALSDQGVQVQNHFYDYGKIAWFSLVYHGNQAVYLRMSVKKASTPIISIRIDNTIAQNVRGLLAGYIEETEKQEVSLLEKITHFLKL
jgi:hypothetical protein